MNQVDGVSNMVLPLHHSVLGRDQSIGTMTATWSLEFYQGGSCPMALSLKPDTSVSPRTPLVPFQLLLQCWSPEGVKF